MCGVSDALTLRQRAVAELSAACLVHVREPIAAVLDRVGVIEQANPGWAAALLGEIDGGEGAG